MAGWTSNIMTWRGDGNVGIGTTNPKTNLSFGGTTAKISMATTDGTDNGQLSIMGGGELSSLRGAYIALNGNEFATNQGNLHLAAGGTSGNITFSTNIGTEYMRLTNGGNVGIGTTAPSHLLDVASQAAITAFGGFATKFKLGEAASGGWIVRFSPSSEGYVIPCGLDDGLAGGQDMPIGVIYHTTPLTAVNSDVWVVNAGKAKVFLDGQAECSYGYFLRTSDTTSGAALASPDPDVPADASHWREIGHAYGHGSGALVNCILHFN